MIYRKEGCIIAFGFSLILAVFSQGNALGEKKKPSAKNAISDNSSSVTSILLQNGARQVKGDATQFELKPGLLLTVDYDNANLAAVYIQVSDQYENPFTEEEQSAKSSYRFIFDPEYRKLISLIKDLKPIGPIEAVKPSSNYGIIGPAGWMRRWEYHANAYISRYERNCREKNVRLGCGVRDIAIQYWLPLEGKVKSKEVVKIGLTPNSQFEDYFAVVAGRRLRLDTEQYHAIKRGQWVKLQYSAGGQRVRGLGLQ